MSIKLSSPGSAAGLSRAQIAGLAAVGLLGMGGSGALVYHLVSGGQPPATAVSADEAKIAAKAEERRSRSEADARKLRQQDLGQGYQFDAQGNLLGATTDATELPQNRTLQDPTGLPVDPQSPAAAAIRRGIERASNDAGQLDDDEDYGHRENRRAGRPADEDLDASPSGSQPTAALTASMLGYSTVAGASWATHRPENGAQGGAGKGSPAGALKEHHGVETIDRPADTVEESTRAPTVQARNLNPQGAARLPVPNPMGTSGYFGGPQLVSAGPSVAGDALYGDERTVPAERSPQSFPSGTVGDMRIGGGVGPDQIVREGKFLDCAVVNQIRADLVDSPVIAMVARDFVSLDGKYVLVPAGSKLLGEAGRVQNLQQERVYIKFDRILFPDQRSAYFPVRKVPAVDGMGAVGIEGDVDRHLFMQFGAAVMLGVLDGLGAAVQSPSAASNPTLRDLVMARTSGDFSTVMSGVIQKYANVVPTVTVEAGAKMKVFFSEDIRVSPYMPTSNLTWVQER
jgi:type IV secretory pathway VirB10-like protein